MIGLSYNKFDRTNEKFDAIIIGSGIGGLSVGSALAQYGKKVLLLEQHYTAGGYTHTFERRGYIWDVGLHYVGGVHLAGSPISKAFRYLSKDKLKWTPLDNAYDRIKFGDKEYDFVCGKENLRQQLKSYFPAPEDKISIDKYFRLLKKVDRISLLYFAEKTLPTWLAKLIGPLLWFVFYKYSDRTTLDVLHDITQNEQLIGVLTAQYGDYGLIPAESSFYMHAILANHYMDGAGYPVGGSAQLAETMVPVIEQAGGAVVVRAAVKSIIVKDNQALGVVMVDGKKIYAHSVVSDAGAFNTFTHLLPAEVVEQHDFKSKLAGVKPSIAHMGLYIGLKDSPENLQLPACNYWVFPNEYNHQVGWERYKNINQPVPVAYVSFPSAKDPDWSKTYPERSTIEVIIIVPYRWFTKYEETNWTRRGDDYEQMKQNITKQLLDIVYQTVPQVKGKVDYCELSTPLATKYFTNHSKGEIYGVAITPQRFRNPYLQPTTPVKNLFLTGGDAMIASIAGGMMGGLLCASAILKKNVIWHILRTVK
ncbi:MAG: NAD(P)/FAD-dependent oxidoreductase [Patescibacteria group bacterium]